MPDNTDILLSEIQELLALYENKLREGNTMPSTRYFTLPHGHHGEPHGVVQTCEHVTHGDRLLVSTHGDHDSLAVTVETGSIKYGDIRLPSGLSITADQLLVTSASRGSAVGRYYCKGEPNAYADILCMTPDRHVFGLVGVVEAKAGNCGLSVALDKNLCPNAIEFNSYTIAILAYKDMEGYDWGMYTSGAIRLCPIDLTKVRKISGVIATDILDGKVKTYDAESGDWREL